MLDQLGGEIVSFNYKSANLGSSPTGVIDLKGLSPNACIAVVFYPMRKFTTGNQTSIILWKKMTMQIVHTKLARYK